MKQYDGTSHMFVVCAYQSSSHLEACVCSLLEQTVHTRIGIATSTPNDHIAGIAKKYDLPVFLRFGEDGIAEDWNFAYSCASAPLVTLAHQDDVYHKEYVKEILKALNQCEHPLIAFSNYNEIRNAETVEHSRLLQVKRLMLCPLRFRTFWRSRFVRRRILSVGNAICCPSVTFVKENLNAPLFLNNMKSNIDWQAWEQISRLEGEFAYVSKAAMDHRIHEESATSRLLERNEREKEDLYMFRKFWPNRIAGMINRIYHKNEALSKAGQRQGADR